MRLEGKTAIVTGAASGFGEAMAKRFADEGANVVVADLNGDGAQKVATEIGERAVALTVDVSRRQDNQAMVAAATTNFGGLDIFVLNAGVTHKNMNMLDVDEETYDRVSNVNMKALYYASLSVIPAMEKRVYKGSLWEVKTVLPLSEVDDSRPILFKTNYGIPNLHCVMGGKLDNIYDVKFVIIN